MGYKESAVKNAIYSLLSVLFIAASLTILDEFMGREARELGLLDIAILYFIVNVKLDLMEKQK